MKKNSDNLGGGDFFDSQCSCTGASLSVAQSVSAAQHDTWDSTLVL